MAGSWLQSQARRPPSSSPDLQKHAAGVEPKPCHRLTHFVHARNVLGTLAISRRCKQEGSRQQQTSRQPVRLVLLINIAREEAHITDPFKGSRLMIQNEVGQFMRQIATDARGTV